MEKIGNLEIRSYIRIRNLLEILAQGIFKELEASISDHSPEIRTIYKWIKYFKAGGESLKDQRRSGRTKTAI